MPSSVCESQLAMFTKKDQMNLVWIPQRVLDPDFWISSVMWDNNVLTSVWILIHQNESEVGFMYVRAFSEYKYKVEKTIYKFVKL